MSAHDDPIRRAVALGDSACPDGQALARLGSLLRDAARPPGAVDLVPAALARLREGALDDDAADAAVDARYDQDGEARGGLARLGELVRAAATPPRPVDLLPAFRRRLAGSSRRLALQPPSGDGRSRWRLVLGVVAAHVAALIVLTLWSDPAVGAKPDAASARAGDAAGGDEPGDDGRDPRGDGMRVGATAASLLPDHLPRDWRELTERHQDLFLPRRSAAQRAQARARCAMGSSAEAVDGCLAWLEAAQDDGGAIGPRDGSLDRDCAVQSFAVLALAGEGGGTAPTDTRRLDCLRRALGWLETNAAEQRRAEAHDPLTTGLAALALVEGAALLDDAHLRAVASDAVAALEAQPAAAGAGGLGGFTLLASETAACVGIAVPARVREQAERIGRGSLPPPGDDDPGRLGLALFARFIYGRTASAGGAQSLERLGEHLPIADQDGQVDPLRWFFPTLALREAGGDAWSRWIDQLQPTLIGALVDEADGRCHARGAQVAYAAAVGPAADVFATSLVALDLQAAYRYLPLAPAR